MGRYCALYLPPHANNPKKGAAMHGKDMKFSAKMAPCDE